MHEPSPANDRPKVPPKAHAVSSNLQNSKNYGVDNKLLPEHLMMGYAALPQPNVPKWSSPQKLPAGHRVSTGNVIQQPVQSGASPI